MAAMPPTRSHVCATMSVGNYHNFYPGLILSLYLLILYGGAIVYVKIRRHQIISKGEIPLIMHNNKIVGADNPLTLYMMTASSTLYLPAMNNKAAPSLVGTSVPFLFYVLSYLVLFDICIGGIILLFPELLSAMNLTCAYKANKFINPIGIRLFGLLLFLTAIFIASMLWGLYYTLVPKNNGDDSRSALANFYSAFYFSSCKTVSFLVYVVLTMIEHGISETYISQTHPIAVSLWIFFGVMLGHCVLLLLSWLISKAQLAALSKYAHKLNLDLKCDPQSQNRQQYPERIYSMMPPPGAF